VRLPDEAELEPPDPSEGFTQIDHVVFTRGCQGPTFARKLGFNLRLDG
jgi:hypothetical protein